MPNRAVSEREPEYQELMAGNAEHKGGITGAIETLPDSKIGPYQDPNYNHLPAVPPIPEAQKNTNVRERVSRLLKNLVK